MASVVVTPTPAPELATRPTPGPPVVIERALPTSAPRHRAVPGLDGIRGVAMLLVLVYHLEPDLMPGGWIGMSMFFPLSGYLITGMLIGAAGDGGRVDLRSFWVRRARRLLPAVYVVLAALVVILVVEGAWDASAGGATWSSIFYVNNWWQLAHSADYWSQFGAARSPFEHLWSLSVEEQFYFAWPLLVAACVRWSRRPVRAALTAATVLTIGGATWGVLSANVWHSGLTPAYYNTFVRGAELLTGALLALWLARDPTAFTGRSARRVLGIAAPLLLTGLVAGGLLVGAQPIADGGMFAVSIVTVVIIAAVIRGAAVGTVLSVAPLRWLGTRCYSLYLWHWPIIVLVTEANTGLHGWDLPLFQLALTFAATVATYWLVEEPIRRGRSHREIWASAH